ncbi:DUF222 domain-containing protein [Terrabacter sp. NPDC000476]|uniref:HNH endonuclease n=1 Tax=Terrabacter sp. NPDC000476 TaxID=3154258 RepID=UPI00332C6BF9
MSTRARHDAGAGAAAPTPGSPAPDELGRLADLLDELSRLDGAALDDAARIDQLTVLERAKAAVAAAQVRVTAAFAASQAQTSREWWDRARQCADVGDFDGWRAARDRARAAALPGDDRRRAGGAGHDDASPGSASPESASPGAASPGAASPGAASRGSRRRRPSAVTGVAAQVALARRESPVRGAAHLTMALALTTSMPCTLAALEAGELNEWRAQILVRETALLTDEQRRVVDAEVVADPAEPVGTLGDRELARRVQAVAYRLDAEAVLARARRAESERRVTLRPAPDTMAYLTALLPVAQAVAAHAALTAAADTARAEGDERSKGQVMADTLVARVTGQETADGVPVEVQLVMTDSALFRHAAEEQGCCGGLRAVGETPAQLVGYGTVPALWARALLDPDHDPAPGPGPADGPGHRPTHGPTQGPTLGPDHDPLHDQGHDPPDATAAARVWLRRLYLDPDTGSLVAMDSRRRVFDGGLRRFVLARDVGTCRTSWCDAPARHVDHVHDHADGGPTSAANGQGLCVRCNHTKQLPGWTARTVSLPGDMDSDMHSDMHSDSERDSDSGGGGGGNDGDPRPLTLASALHAVETTTPTGHRYVSLAPPLLPGLTIGADAFDEAGGAGETSTIEERLLHLLAQAA